MYKWCVFVPGVRSYMSTCPLGACQDKPQMKMALKFHLDGFSFDCKEVFILLLRHLGSAGIGVNLKVTCHEGDRQLR